MTGNFTPPDPSTLFAQSAESFTRFWTDCARKMSDSARQQAATPPTPDAIREMRNAFLNALGTAYDEYLRSPEFTQMLSQMLQSGVQFQQRMSEMLGHTRHSMQGASRQDIDTIMEVVQHLERRITDSMARLDERLSSIEQNLATGAAAKPAARKVAKKTARKAAKKSVRKSAQKKAARKTAKKKSTRRKSS
jgi:hypothetical protein